MTAPAQLALPEWVCLRCGTEGATKQEGYLQFDDRYATGYCDECNDPAAIRKTPRPVQRLIRSDVFDREVWQARREKDELAALVKEYSAGGATIKMKDTNIVRLVTLFDKHGSPGFVQRR